MYGTFVKTDEFIHIQDMGYLIGSYKYCVIECNYELELEPELEFETEFESKINFVTRNILIKSASYIRLPYCECCHLFIKPKTIRPCLNIVPK